MRELRQKIREILEGVFTILPGKLISFDRTTRRGQVRLKMKKRLNRGDDEIEGPAPFERPDVHKRSQKFGESFPWDDQAPLVLGFFQREGDWLTKDLESRTPGSTRVHHPQDATILGALRAEDDSKDPDFGDDWVLAFSRDNPTKLLKLTPDDVWVMRGGKVIIESNDGEVSIENTVTGHSFHIDPNGNESFSGKSLSVDTDSGDMSVNGRNLLSELDDLDKRVSDLEG